MIDLVGSWTVFNIPDTHHASQLLTFDWSRLPQGEKIKAGVVEFLQKVEAEEAPHLLLLGQQGTGKSHLLYGIYRWAVLRTDLTNVCALHVPIFCDNVKRSFSGGADPFDEVKPAKYLLAYDDIFGRELSKHDMQVTIPRLLEIANHNKAALVVTTNYTLPEIQSMLPPHEVDRLLERGTIIQFTGPSSRLMNA